MKNTDIEKIRQLLNPILEIPWQPTPKRASGGYIVEIDADDKDLIVGSVQETLALLPCVTCGDSGRVPTFDQASGLADADPCPDCNS